MTYSLLGFWAPRPVLFSLCFAPGKDDSLLAHFSVAGRGQVFFRLGLKKRWPTLSLLWSFPFIHWLHCPTQDTVFEVYSYLTRYYINVLFRLNDYNYHNLLDLDLAPRSGTKLHRNLFRHIFRVFRLGKIWIIRSWASWHSACCILPRLRLWKRKLTRPSIKGRLGWPYFLSSCKCTVILL